MTHEKELKWGETPFDKMSHDELLRSAQRMYSAVNSVRYVLFACSDASAFWGTQGTGGTAREKVRQVLDAIHAEYSDEQIYRSFFRYADDLLFDAGEYRIGSRWGVCPVCGQMFGASLGGEPSVGRECNSFLPSSCEGVLRALEWDDLNPVHEKETPQP